MKQLSDCQMVCISGGGSAAEDASVCNKGLLIGFGMMTFGLICMAIPASALIYGISAAIGGISSTVGFYAQVLSC